MVKLIVLFEHASGYFLFDVKEFEEIGMLLPQVESSVNDLPRFKSIVSLKAFTPFKTAVVALENINSISEGVLPEILQNFIEANLPKKKKKVILGVGDSKLAGAINEALEITSDHTGVVPEIIRGIRQHFAKLSGNFTDKSAQVAQLGLGHSYSRAKIKFNVHRSDNMIIQSIALLDQLDKDINTFCMRIREWYSYHFPELYKIVPENYLYSKLCKAIGDKNSLTEESIDKIEEIVMDRGKAEAIVEASKSSMGMEISPIDLANIEHFAGKVVGLVEYRLQLAEYLHTKMVGVAPNLSTLIGDQVGARLISHAGSLTNLAKFPASTVQILGAEKALFRALKTKSNTPKYGLLYHSSFITKADSKNKGRISRFVANKCSLASRIDCFIDNPSRVFGEKLKQQVEDRLKFYLTGEFPPKTIDVMKEAIQEVESASKKKNKKKSKQNKEENVNGIGGINNEEEITLSPKKKKSKGKDVSETEITPVTSSKKKKKRASEVQDIDETLLDDNSESPPKKKKKKNKKKNLDDDLSVI